MLDDEVRVFFAETVALGAAEIALLQPDERERHARLIRSEDRADYLAAHVLLRNALSKLAGVSPAEWRFAKDDRGKPRIASPASSWQVSLTHTRGLVACAVAFRPVGVDAETKGSVASPLSLATRYFAASEVEVLRKAQDVPGTFVAIWTLKESYVKATGDGLSTPLELFAFDEPEGDAPRVRFEAGLADDPALWHFARLSMPRHGIAVAARGLERPRFLVERMNLA